MKCLAVIDTNVIVSALISKNINSPTKNVLRAMLNGDIVPLYHEEIINEYEDVLKRKKFNIKEETINLVIEAIKEFGIEINPKSTGEILIDNDDLIFYEVAMDKQESDAYLVTGNLKHYPNKKFIVTPLEMVDILNKQHE